MSTGKLAGRILCICCVAFAGLMYSAFASESALGPKSTVAPSFKIITYNVNWVEPRPELAAEIIRQSGADIVCLQETTQQWEQFLRSALATNYSFMKFRDSTTRTGGGFAFLSKLPAREISFVPSDTGWFGGWIMRFETALGPVQVLNIHLHPPVSDRGSWVSGYFTTKDDRVREIERFYAARQPDLPMLVAGDFNDTETSAAVRWLQIYSPELRCSFVKVQRAGASDHFPVEAIFTKQGTTDERKKENVAGETGGQ